MKFVFSLALVAFSLRLAAQTNVPVISPVVSGDKLFYANKVEKYKRMKTTGTLLLVGGGILAVAGIATLSTIDNSGYNSSSSSSQNSQDSKAASAMLMILGAEAFIGAGIPLTIIGSKQSKKWQRKLDAISFNFKLTPQQQGLALTYKF